MDIQITSTKGGHQWIVVWPASEMLNLNRTRRFDSKREAVAFAAELSAK